MSKQYDLEERTYQFAKEVRKLLFRSNPDKYLGNDQKQLLRSSGSIGANYIEANESITDKETQYRLMICKKEAKESVYWLRLLEFDRNIDQGLRVELMAEAKELTHIFGAILRNVQKSSNI